MLKETPGKLCSRKLLGNYVQGNTWATMLKETPGKLCSKKIEKRKTKLELKGNSCSSRGTGTAWRITSGAAGNEVIKRETSTASETGAASGKTETRNELVSSLE
ncbi:hypothetical protein AVEN_108847-1 [Araneus ventricosus]|uniref:Uncharacterized protein n=1 Tax=Araneus ventricosus TaxID=182803 RepID=A0A4Y2SKS8_ARAVE|nr:hypothetical protein AVEN_108847-1 [Araneus ventricosus]